MTEQHRVFLNETGERQLLLAVHDRTTTVRLFRARPVHVFELPAERAFAAGGAAPLAQGDVPGLLSAALRHLLANPGHQLLVAGHGADEGLSARRAAAVLALLRGDEAAFGAATGEAAATAWSAWGRLLPPARGELVACARPAVGCGAHWPLDRVRLEDYPARAAERVDLLAFAPHDAPALACHAGPTCEPRACDVYRKGKYRAARAGAPPAPPSGTLLVVRVVNAKGLPLEGVVVRVTLPDGAPRGGATDAAGEARIDTFPHVEGEVLVDLPDFRSAPA